MNLRFVRGPLPTGAVPDISLSLRFLLLVCMLVQRVVENECIDNLISLKNNMEIQKHIGFGGYRK